MTNKALARVFLKNVSEAVHDRAAAAKIKK